MNEVVERMLRDPKVAKIVHDARLFNDLRENPGWKRLFEVVSARKAKWMDSVSQRFMGPKKYWPAPEEIAYYQGFYQGAVFVLAHPEHAEANLERAARVAWALTQDEPEE